MSHCNRRRIHLALAGLLAFPAILCSQRGPSNNPFARSPEAVQAGARIYTAQCAVCHGKDAHGGEGPDLYRSQVVVIGKDRSLFDVIRNGIPGTEMLAFKLADDQVWQTVSYLHALTRPGMGPQAPGDVEAGRRVFHEAGCDGCHLLAGRGGVIGPDLSSIALQRSTEEIRRRILNPNEDVADEYRSVTVETKLGQKIVGQLKNQDNFSLQIMLPDGEFALLLRSEAKKVDIVRRSSMPADYSSRLTPQQIQNLLAFLDRQRASFLKFQPSFQNY